MILRNFYVLLLLMAGSMSPAAWSACTVTIANASFGSVTSVAINSTAQPTSSSMVVACDNPLSMQSTDRISMQLVSAGSFAGTRATLTNIATGDVIPIRVCGSANCAENSEVAMGSTFSWSGSVMPGLLDARSWTLPIYFMTVPGQQVSAGSWLVTLNLLIDYQLCAVGGVYCDTGSQIPRTLQLDLTVSNDCLTINAPAVNFGSAPLVENFATLSQSIILNCTKGSDFTIGIDNGLNAVNGVRYMLNGSARMAYEIYKDNTANRWGSSGAQRRSSTEGILAADSMTRIFNYTAKVLTSQSTPAISGDYTDTLVVDIIF